MRGHVGALARAEHREDAEAGAERREAAAARHAATHECVGRERADGGEHGGRRADRVVSGAAQERVREVAERAGGDEQREPDAGAEARPERAGEDGGGEHVAEHVLRVGVQRERRRRAPPLAVEDAQRARAALREPAASGLALARHLEEAEERDGERGERGPREGRERLERRLRCAAVLELPLAQELLRALPRRRPASRPPSRRARARASAARPSRVEHEHALVGVALAARARDDAPLLVRGHGVARLRSRTRRGGRDRDARGASRRGARRARHRRSRERPRARPDGPGSPRDRRRRSDAMRRARPRRRRGRSTARPRRKRRRSRAPRAARPRRARRRRRPPRARPRLRRRAGAPRRASRSRDAPRPGPAACARSSAAARAPPPPTPRSARRRRRGGAGAEQAGQGGERPLAPRADAGAGSAPRRHEAELLERAQALPQVHAAHAETKSEIALRREARSFSELAARDQPRELTRDSLTHRLDGPIGLTNIRARGSRLSSEFARTRTRG